VGGNIREPTAGEVGVGCIIFLCCWADVAGQVGVHSGSLV